MRQQFRRLPWLGTGGSAHGSDEAFAGAAQVFIEQFGCGLAFAFLNQLQDPVFSHAMDFAAERILPGLPDHGKLESLAAAAHASCNRTCELGMTRAEGVQYRHVLKLLEEVTRWPGASGFRQKSAPQ